MSTRSKDKVFYYFGGNSPGTGLDWGLKTSRLAPPSFSLEMLKIKTRTSFWNLIIYFMDQNMFHK